MLCSPTSAVNDVVSCPLQQFSCRLLAGDHVLSKFGHRTQVLADIFVGGGDNVAVALIAAISCGFCRCADRWLSWCTVHTSRCGRSDGLYVVLGPARNAPHCRGKSRKVGGPSNALDLLVRPAPNSPVTIIPPRSPL